MIVLKIADSVFNNYIEQKKNIYILRYVTLRSQRNGCVWSCLPIVFWGERNKKNKLKEIKVDSFCE